MRSWCPNFEIPAGICTSTQSQKSPTTLPVAKAAPSRTKRPARSHSHGRRERRGTDVRKHSGSAGSALALHRSCAVPAAVSTLCPRLCILAFKASIGGRPSAFPGPHCFPHASCWRAASAWTAVHTTVLTMSGTVQPRDRSLTGSRSPCTGGGTHEAQGKLQH